MTFFKVSFSADSLEGLTALAGLPASTGESVSGSSIEGVLPPPNPFSQNMGATDNGAVVAPPPISEEYSLMSGGLNQNVSDPPAPAMQSTGVSGAASTSDQVAPPPSPISGGMTGDGHTIQTDIPPPPQPDAFSPVTAGDQAGEAVSPPPAPRKRQTKSAKKAKKT